MQNRAGELPRALLIVVIVAAVSALALIAGLRYEGHWFVYLVFTVISNALLFSGFRKNAIYFDTFIGLFLWFGFWLKLSYRVAFKSGLFREAVGVFDGSAQTFDHALTVSCVGLAAFLLASFARQRFFCYPSEAPSCARSGLFMFYRTYRLRFVAVFLLLVVWVSLSNALWGVYQRGMVTQLILPLGLNGIYKWLLQFGLASIAAVIIRFEIELGRSLSVVAVLPTLIEGFLSNVSLLSRGMVLNASAFVVGGWRLIRAKKLRLKPLGLIASASAFVALFAFSVFAVNFLRAETLANVKTTEYAVAVAKDNGPALFIDRWVGIEGVMAVSSSGILGWDLWREAWGEKFQAGTLSLYDQRLIDSPYQSPTIDKAKHHFVSLPGIIAFFYYPGSLGFLFAGLFFCGLFAAAVELLVYRLGGHNWLLCSLLAQVVAFRYASFGYVPAQSYLLFGTLLVNVLLFFVADQVVRRRFFDDWRGN